VLEQRLREMGGGGRRAPPGGLRLGKKEILRRFAPQDDGQRRMCVGLGGWKKRWFSMGEIYGKGLNTEDTERKTEGTEALWRRTRFGGRWL
jgi:hypothetical protein